ncbi:MAG: hypothetical protein L0241_00185 [Planctomycetia bacterium]|nr:hypothetical protein [Planctomycetia bacterium]
MTMSTWRAGEIPLPDGVIAIDVSGSGRLTRQFVSFQKHGVSHEISSLSELASVLHSSGADTESLAATDPSGFAYLLCLLSGRPHHIFPRESMWPELEQHFALERSACQPRVTDGKFQFVAYSQYMPTLKVSRLTVDLKTLQVTEEPLVSAPWPPTA